MEKEYWSTWDVQVSIHNFFFILWNITEYFQIIVLVLTGQPRKIARFGLLVAAKNKIYLIFLIYFYLISNLIFVFKLDTHFYLFSITRGTDFLRSGAWNELRERVNLMPAGKKWLYWKMDMFWFFQNLNSRTQ